MQTPGLTPHQAQARFYMLPRAVEALRLRGALHDSLAAHLFPYDETTSNPYSQALTMMSNQRQAIDNDKYSPAPGSTFLPTKNDTPLYLRGQAVDRFINDELSTTLHQIRRRMASKFSTHASPNTSSTSWKLQVVDLGAGLNTRPWALPALADVTWFDVDQAEVLNLKKGLLEAAGAQCEQHPPHVDLDGISDVQGDPRSSKADINGPFSRPQATFPLFAKSYAMVSTDVTSHDGSHVAWIDALKAAGWDPTSPTVFLAVAIVYYLEQDQATALMHQVAQTANDCGAPCVLIGTVMNKGMVHMIQQYQGGSAKQKPSNDVQRAATASDAIAGGEAVKAATGVKFGVDGDVDAFLRACGWQQAEEISTGDIEHMYHCITLGLEYPPQLREEAKKLGSGKEPACCVGIARTGFKA